MTCAPALSIGVAQAPFGDDLETNLARAEDLVREMARAGASIVVLPELFAYPYFCKVERDEFFDLAAPLDGHPVIERFARVAAELGVVVPVSFFERDGQVHYNSVAVVDADGRVLGVYRKSHIPDGPGYEEKFYFRPGDTGFRVWETRAGRIGVGICWDQWFPEAARAMVLAGAEVLIYPSTIGSEPAQPQLDTCAPWRRVMIGHAVASAVPVAAANRTGVEDGQSFYGHSFVSDSRGDLVADLGDVERATAVVELDRAELARYRASFGFFRDRRPELYASLSAVRRD
jgi:N-carbamoylputrescine amidase